MGVGAEADASEATVACTIAPVQLQIPSDASEEAPIQSAAAAAAERRRKLEETQAADVQHAGTATTAGTAGTTRPVMGSTTTTALEDCGNTCIGQCLVACFTGCCMACCNALFQVR
jgi:hypothetical protein